MAQIPTQEIEKIVEKCLEGKYFDTKYSVYRDCIIKKLDEQFHDIIINDSVQNKTQRTITIGKVMDKKRFEYTIRIIQQVLEGTGTIINCEEYDGLIVKKLSAYNVATENAPDSQTHMEFSGDQKYIFPFLMAREYLYPLNSEPTERSILKENSLLSSILKNYFLLKIPISLRKSNLFYLETGEKYEKDEKFLPCCSTVLLDNRDKMEVSSQLSMNGPYFKELRRLLKIDDYFILLKKNGEISYDAYGIKKDYITDENDEFTRLHNKFFCRDFIAQIRPNAFKGLIDDFVFDRLDNGENLLYYGVPGCGKSHEIKKLYEKDESCVERVIFHPDYTYSDFIGQILPKTEEGNITYPFTLGPFTRILEKAYKNPFKSYYLIIEEINRGNAPAIFGDIFQLLDRMDKDSFNYKKGTSKYGITNREIAKIVYGEEFAEEKIRIPSNLSIVASMNTSDQNVFTLDNAFQRRWSMKLVPNTFDNVNNDFKDTNRFGSNISWETFCNRINEIILDENSLNLSSEDKRLGVYFVNENELQNREKFSEKVLKYLWDDAFKFNRDAIFKKKYKSLEEVITYFNNEKTCFDVFKDGLFETRYDIETPPPKDEEE